MLNFPTEIIGIPHHQELNFESQEYDESHGCSEEEFSHETFGERKREIFPNHLSWSRSLVHNHSVGLEDQRRLPNHGEKVIHKGAQKRSLILAEDILNRLGFSESDESRADFPTGDSLMFIVI